ncbi:MAG: sensor histidine kinase [Actinomycetota bacterium]
MAFNLFDAEDRLLEEAEALRRSLADAAPELRAGVDGLIEAFRRSVREQRRLVKVSDRLQAQLGAANQELAKRRAEAEDALVRLRETQESLVQSEKLASLGGLVAGVAHEINTPVGIALSCASHLADAVQDIRTKFEADDVAVDDFERFMETAADTSRLVLANCERAAGLIRSFKQVAVDRTSAERRRFDLALAINETLASLGPGLRQGGHAVEVDCPAGIVVDGYPGALSQILTNLVMNSLAHAFDAGERGRLAVTVTTPDDATVRLVYADDGKGIPAEYRGRIFDPFFTTRRGSGGTGLGLHIAFNLATGPMRGSLALEPAAQGTAFALTFPRS